MRRRFSSGSALAAVLTALVGALVALVVWIALSAPLAFGLVHPRPVPPPDEAPPRRAASDVATPRLTAAVLLSQAGTEVTDFLAPYAILAASGAFTVHAVAPERAPAPVNGGMAILPELTFEELDARHPGGVDVVILPNVLDPGSPRLRDWVRRQAARGALVASICEGARLLAGTGLLDGRDATSHFAALASLRAAHPSVRWHGDRRWVEDGAFVTSAGVTAAIDAALHVVARVAGDDAAARASRELRLARASEATWAGTQLAGSDVATGVLNGAFAWPRRTVAVPLENGVDELALAAVLDAYPRTFAARSTTVTSARRPVRSRHGLALVGESTPATIPSDASIVQPSAFGTSEPAFDGVLRAIAREHGGATAVLVARQLEYRVAKLRLDAPRPTAAWLGALAGLAIVGGCGAGAGLSLRALWRRRKRRARAS